MSNMCSMVDVQHGQGRCIVSDSLIEKYAAVHALLDEIADATSDSCTELEVAELAITHEHAVRKMGSIGLQRILDVSDREAYRAVQASKLDPHRERILEFLKHGVAKSAIARMLGTSRTNLANYIKTRGLEAPKGE